MTRRLAVLLAAALAVPVLLLAPGGPPSAADDTSTTITVDDARLTWGVNDESNTKAFAPGTYNFLSAGAVPDPGKGGQTITSPGVWRGTSTTAWRARSGDVTLEKQQPDGGYARATFAGLSTTVAGDPIPSTGGPFSGHRVVLDGGTGTLDPAAGTADLRWTGAFSIVYYSGYTFVTVTDPHLVVTPDRAVVRATLAGYAADRENPDVWTAVKPVVATIATLPRTELTLPEEGGFTATPAYAGVRYTPPASTGGSQVRDGDGWGSWPPSYVRYLDRLGSGAFWYSSGGEADPYKAPLPLTVSYAAAAPVEPEPTATPTDGPTSAATSTPALPTTTLQPLPPTVVTETATVTQTATVTTTVTAAPAPAPVAPPTPAAVPTAAEPSPVTVAPGATPTAVLALTAAEPAAAPTSSPPDGRWRWWLGSLLLAAALGVVLTTLLPSLGRTRRP